VIYKGLAKSDNKPPMLFTQAHVCSGSDDPVSTGVIGAKITKQGQMIFFSNKKA
jgi:hypothetical protein